MQRIKIQTQNTEKIEDLDFKQHHEVVLYRQPLIICKDNDNLLKRITI